MEVRLAKAEPSLRWHSLLSTKPKDENVYTSPECDTSPTTATAASPAPHKQNLLFFCPADSRSCSACCSGRSLIGGGVCLSGVMLARATAAMTRWAHSSGPHRHCVTSDVRAKRSLSLEPRPKPLSLSLSLSLSSGRSNRGPLCSRQAKIAEMLENPACALGAQADHVLYAEDGPAMKGATVSPLPPTGRVPLGPFGPLAALLIGCTMGSPDLGRQYPGRCKPLAPRELGRRNGNRQGLRVGAAFEHGSSLAAAAG